MEAFGLLFLWEIKMGGVFSKPKSPAVVQPVETPEVVDTSDKVREEEKGRKKRKGVASQIVSGGADLSGIQTTKKTLGA